MTGRSVGIRLVAAGVLVGACASLTVSVAAAGSPSPRPVSTDPPGAPPTPTPTASPSPAPYTMTYGPGSCEGPSAAAWCSATPAPVTSDHPYPWWSAWQVSASQPWRPEQDGPVTTVPTPTVYVSDDGYHWVLRPGRPQ